MLSTAGDLAVQRLAVFDVDGTLIEGQTQRMLVWHLALNGMLPWPVFIQALWWFTKYRLRLIDDADEVRNKVLRLFAGIPARDMERLIEEFCATVIFPRLKEDAMAEIDRSRDAGMKVILVSSSICLLVRQIAEHVGADGWVATNLEIADGKLTGRISGRVVYGKEKFAALQRYADGTFGSWLLHAAYGDHGSDASLLKHAKNPVVVCPDRELKRIATLNGWRAVIWN